MSLKGFVWQLGEVFAAHKIKNVILILSWMLLGVTLQPHMVTENIFLQNIFQKHKGEKSDYQYQHIFMKMKTLLTNLVTFVRRKLIVFPLTILMSLTPS